MILQPNTEVRIKATGKRGKVLSIYYKVKLKDGTIVDVRITELFGTSKYDHLEEPSHRRLHHAYSPRLQIASHVG